MNDTTKAVLFALTTFLCFSIGDAITKLVLEKYHPIQVQMWLVLWAVIWLIPAAPLLGGYKTIIKMPRPLLSIARGIVQAAQMLCIVYALSMVTLTTFYSVIFTAPLLSTIAAMVLFKEPLTKTKAGCLAVGFLGVLIIAQPGTDINPTGVILVLISAVFFSFLSLSAKFFDTSSPRLPLVFYPFLTTFLAFFVLSDFEIEILAWQELALMGFAGFLSVIGLTSMTYAFKLADAGVVAPYHYSQLIWGALLGYFLFGDIPGAAVLAGAALIIGAGLYLFAAENGKLDKIKSYLMRERVR